VTADAAYRYHGRPDWNPAAVLASLPAEAPSLSSAEIAALAGVNRKTVWNWARKPGFPAPLDRPWSRERRWPEEAVTAWLRSRNLVSGRARGG